MKGRAPVAALLCASLLAVHAVCSAAPKPDSAHRFGVIGNSFAHGGGEAQLEQALAATSDARLAFVVATGIKRASEPCSDELYTARRDMFEQARRPMIVAPAASDWSGCVYPGGRPAAIERLNRLRELFYAEPTALGMHTLPLTRLSASAKFRSYAENAHWIVGKVMYATINLPANNNHYRAEAGRNSEFEDRSVANRVWLNRVFGLANRKKLDALVLFSEGDVKVLEEEPGLLARLGRRNDNRQDGFAAARRQVRTLATKFKGKVLLVDTAPLPNGSEPAIEWRGNLGHLSVGSAVVDVRVTADAKNLFRLEKP